MNINKVDTYVNTDDDSQYFATPRTSHSTTEKLDKNTTSNQVYLKSIKVYDN